LREINKVASRQVLGAGAGISVPLLEKDLRRMELFGAQDKVLNDCEAKIKNTLAVFLQGSETEKKRLEAEVTKVRERMERVITSTLTERAAAERIIVEDLQEALSKVQNLKKEFKNTGGVILNTKILHPNISNYADLEHKRAERTKQIMSSTQTVLEKTMPYVTEPPMLKVESSALCRQLLASPLFTVVTAKTTFEPRYTLESEERKRIRMEEEQRRREEQERKRRMEEAKRRRAEEDKKQKEKSCREGRCPKDCQLCREGKCPKDCSRRHTGLWVSEPITSLNSHDDTQIEIPKDICYRFVEYLRFVRSLYGEYISFEH